MNISLFDLKEYYLNYNEAELIRILEELVRSYFNLYLRNNFEIFEKSIGKMQNETEISFKIRFQSKEVSIDFVFTKDVDNYNKEIIVPNMFISSSSYKSLENFVPKNIYLLDYLPDSKSICYLMTSNVTSKDMKSLLISTMFEIALKILFQRAVNTKLN